MTDSKKRKDRAEGDRDIRGPKKSKGGSGGRWQTPHQQVKIASRAAKRIEPGDKGIWATCARGQERRATEELNSMLEECAKRFYGISQDAGEDEHDSVDDIEALIKKELSEQKTILKLFTPVHLDLQCVLFFKTPEAIDPVDFVHRICKEVVATPNIRKLKYVNRLTPMSLMGKATESGLREVTKTVLEKHFELVQEEDDHETEKGTASKVDRAASYAIRTTIRNHTALQREAVIKQVASAISNDHKVDLSNPDKVIIIEIFQTVCGISVAGSDWEALKRFNLAELYKPLPNAVAAGKAEAIPQSVTTDEAPVARDDTIPDRLDA